MFQIRKIDFLKKFFTVIQRAPKSELHGPFVTKCKFLGPTSDLLDPHYNEPPQVILRRPLVWEAPSRQLVPLRGDGGGGGQGQIDGGGRVCLGRDGE